ncbi:MAG: hypothetical protein E7446_02550 [Ruminococcaceae bacterium]|nr:hypothetical protein [Oscillospiraceae bacterium]
MQKALSIAAVAIGALVMLSAAATRMIGAVFSVPTPDSVGVIGGADGPTVIMLSGTVGAGSVIIAIAIGFLLIIAGVWGLRKIKQ